MGYPVLDLVADLFFSVFGNGLIMGIIIIGLLTTLILVMRGNLAVVLMTLIPVIIGIVLGVANSNFIMLPAWFLIVLFICAGFIFSLFFLFFIR